MEGAIEASHQVEKVVLARRKSTTARVVMPARRMGDARRKTIWRRFSTAWRRLT
jgi:hypothetical protein